MKVVLEIDKTRIPKFFDIIKDLKYVKVIKENNNRKFNKIAQELLESFQNIKQFEAGKKNLKKAKDLLNEL